MRLPQCLRRNKHDDGPHTYAPIHLNNAEANIENGYNSNYISTTKYTAWNFIPKNLFEQFRRATNIFFLSIVIITLIPEISPLTPWTSVIPLVFVLTVTAVKEGYEDFKRYKSDKAVNNKVYEVINGVTETGEARTAQIASRDLVVGQYVKIYQDQVFPTDMVLLFSNLDDGNAYMETAQLDGETNLKALKSANETSHWTLVDIFRLKGTLDAEPPLPSLGAFKGRFTLEGDPPVQISLGIKQLFLRGAVLRNTNWAVGITVYAGNDTKQMLNMKSPPSKFSTVERKLNKIVVGIFLFMIVCAFIMAILSGASFTISKDDKWYLDFDKDEEDAVYGIKAFFSYYALLSFLIPMSMMVTLEVVKVSQVKFMEWDDQMALDPTNVSETGMAAKTSNLNDELAQISYVFSDKTGTLTENRMEFSLCSIGGRQFEKAPHGELRDVLIGEGFVTRERHQFNHPIKEFLLCMAVCQNVVAEEKDGEVTFKAQSPDEEALVKVARDNGFIFRKRKNEGVTVDVLGESDVYEELCVMEFSSERRRMSVLVRDPRGRYLLYTKGADSMIYSRLAAGQDSDEAHEALKQTTTLHLKDFSKKGLRTLAVGVREFSESEYREFAAQYHEANTDIEQREKLVAAVFDRWEKNFRLIGCTAIEDRLQQEVPETIAYLLQAGVKVWMITGDKEETAIEIGKSCRLLTSSMTVLKVSEDTVENTDAKMKEYVEQYVHGNASGGAASAVSDSDDAGPSSVRGSVSTKKRKLGLVLNGAVLSHVLKNRAAEVLALAEICHSVICCRASPGQKADVVRLIKTNKKGIVTLAIGDGANDVSMIQEAHVGVGIYGREGTQAAASSDYAIRQFRFLRRLLCVHGRYSLLRNSQLIHMSLYKNMAFFFVQFWFSFFNGYSAQTVYDDWVVTLYNIIFTVAPPYIVAIFDRDIDEKIIDHYPEVYRSVQTGKQFSYYTVLHWMLFAFYHSLVAFFCGFLMGQNDILYPDGQNGGGWVMGTTISTAAVFIVLLFLALGFNLWNGFVHFFIWGSMVAYILVILIESHLGLLVPNMTGVFENIFRSGPCYFTILIAIIIALLPKFVVKCIHRAYFPEDWMVLQEKAKKEGKVTRKIELSEMTSMPNGRRERRPSEIEL